MSGGHFDYQQYRIGQIADDIQLLIDNNDSTETNEWGDRLGRGYPPEVIEHFKEAVVLLRKGQIYAQRIDWLVSGDDGENSFLRRLEEELQEVKERT
jgi:hypothetical protein